MAKSQNLCPQKFSAIPYIDGYLRFSHLVRFMVHDPSGWQTVVFGKFPSGEVPFTQLYAIVVPTKYGAGTGLSGMAFLTTGNLHGQTEKQK